jgi:hypothetical protein
MTASVRVEAVGSSKMLLNVYQTTRHHMSEDSKLHKILIENLMQKNIFEYSVNLIYYFGYYSLAGNLF